MSNTVDSRVLEMRFDNRHFENNVSTTMSTLDKLKQKLHLDGATKGLENVNAAAKNVNMTGLGNAVETVGAKFSAMQVIGVTALANITNSAVNAGKRIVSALTIEPVRSGFSEYEMKMDSIKTIVNSTGRDLKDVNRLLEELNEYSDQTIYSFKDMTQNIGKFTNAGVGLEDAVLAIKGISNEAAVSGASAAEASRAMYNFSQALSAGYVKLIDWKSIENANMATKEFKQQLIDTAVELGVVTKSGDMYTTSTGKSFNATKNFNDVLQEQWMTTDVLIKTLGKYADENTEIGKKAFAAAQEVTKFTQMWDVLKETAQSGWAKTWETIVGDLNSAKAVFTPLTNFFSSIITRMDDARNRVLEIALNFAKPWTAITDKLGSIKKVTESVGNFADKLKYYQDIVTKVWRGDYNNRGDNPDRFDLLTKAGYDPRVVQTLVNKGYRYKLTVEDIEEAHKKFGLTLETTKEETKETTDALNSLSDEQLKNAGLTEDEIALYRALESEAARTGTTVSALADEMSKTSGRDLLIESFKNIGGAAVDMAKAIKSAWNNIFNPPSVEVMGIRLYGMIKSLKEFTESLRLTDEKTGELNETGLKFQRVFKGIFAAVDIVVTILGGPLKLVFKAVTQLLKYFGIGVLDVAAFIGDAIVAFRDWIDSVFDFTKIFDKVVPPITDAINAFREWIRSLRDSENLPRDIAAGIVGFFDGVFDAIINFFKKIPEYLKKIPELFKNGFDLSGVFGDSPLTGFIDKIRDGLGVAGQVIVEIGKILHERIRGFLSRTEFAGISSDSIAGLVQGFKNGATNVWNVAVSMVTGLVNKVKEFLGIHSPSTVFAAIGGFIIAGLIAGLQNGIPDSLGAIKDVFQPMLDWVKGIDLGAVFAGIVGIGTVSAAGKAATALKNFSEPFSEIGGILDNVKDLVKNLTKPIKNVVNGFAKIEKAVAFNVRMDGIKTLATSLLMLVGAIVVLTFFEPAKLWNAVGVVLALAAILAVLAIAMNKINSASASFDFKEGLNIQGLSTGLFGIGAALLLLGITVKLIGSLDPEQAKQGFLGLLGLVVAVGLVLLAFGTLVKGKSAQNIDKFGKMMTKMGIALLLFVAVIKIISMMSFAEDQINTIIGVLGGFLAMVLAMALISKLAGKNIDKMSSMMLKMSVALLLMIGVVKLAAGLSKDELLRGANFLVVFTIFVAILAGIGALGGKRIEGVGRMMLGLSVSMLILIGVMKLIGMLTVDELLKGMAAIIVFSIIIALLVKSVMKNGSEAPKVAATILAFGLAIGILAAVAIVCGLIKLEKLAIGIAAVAVLSAMMGVLIRATRGANQVTGNIIAITVAIGLLVACVALLTLIDPVKLAITTGLVSVLMGMFTLIVKVAGSVNKAMGTIIAMTGAIVVLGGVLYLLSTLPVENTIASAIALSVLMGVMTGILAILQKIGAKASSAYPAIGAMAVLGLVVGELALILGLMSVYNVTGSIERVASLSALLVVMTGVLAVLSVIGPMATAAYPAMGALAVLIAGFAVLLGVLGGLMELIPGAEDFLDKGIVVMEKIGQAIGAFVGGLVGGIALGAMSSLPEIGRLLSEFMGNLEPFITGIKQVDDKVLAGAGILTATIIMFTVAELLAGIAAMAGVGLVAMGAELSAFMLAAKPFLLGASMITEDMMSGVKALADTILILTAANVIQGLTSLFGGGNSLENFAKQLPTLGEGLASFSESLGAFTEEQLNTVNCAANAIKTLASASQEIPNTGGLLGMLVGENDLGTFASQFPVLGAGLRDFLNSVGTFSEDQIATVNCAAEAIKTLAAASKEIPNSGGLIGDIVGNNDLGTFASQFPQLGKGLRDFLTNVGTFTDAEATTVDCAASAIKSLAGAAKEIPNSGGWVGAIVGENNLGDFANQFPFLGTGIRGLLENLGTFTEDEQLTVTSAAEVVKTLAAVAKNIPSDGGWIQKLVGSQDLGDFASKFPQVGKGIKGFVENLGTFSTRQVATVNAGVAAIDSLGNLAECDMEEFADYGDDFADALPNFAKKLKEFCTNMPAKARVENAVENIRNILSVAKSIGKANTDVFPNFADNLKKVGSDAVKKFIGAFTDTIAKINLKAKANELAGYAVSGAKEKYTAMFGAGEYLVDGFAAGITDRTWYAEAKAKAMANAAEKAAKEALDINSPSKVFRAIGYSVPEGFAMGIDKMSSMASDSSTNMANAAIDNVRNSISRIANMVSTDIDTQPTIRPVMDLTDVKTGVGAIGSMLNMGSTIGVRANVGAISTMMNSRGQNGVNSDVVSAIDKLRSDLSNLSGGDTYQINGITYDDGSNIHDAVGTLVRAAKIARRV